MDKESKKKYNRTVGRKLRIIREGVLRMSQTELGELLNYTRAHTMISQIEQGHKGIGKHRALKACEAAGVDVEWLIDGHDYDIDHLNVSRAFFRLMRRPADDPDRRAVEALVLRSQK